MNQRRPKFTPQTTPLNNYQQGAIAWSFFMLTYDKPLGPRVSQYDPYYMYSVQVHLNNEWTEHTWFTTVEDHIRIQSAGATKDSVFKCTYVTDQKKRALVIEHTSGPVVQRDGAQVRAETEQAVQQLLTGGNGQQDHYGSSFDNSNLINPPQPQPAQATLPNPFETTQTAPQQIAPPPPQPSAQPTPQPPPPPAPAPQPTPTPPAPTPTTAPTPPSRMYQRFTEQEKEAWKVRYLDILELQLFAYGALMEKAKELKVKVKPSDQRELATSASIQTWREFSKVGGLYGWGYIEPEEEIDPSTKDGALRIIDQYTKGHFPNKTVFVKKWMSDVAQPIDSNWQHVANIAKLLGIDSQVVFDEFDTITLIFLSQAIWIYQGCRDEGMTRNEALEFVAEDMDMPIEQMDFEEEDDDEDGSSD